MTRTPHSRSPDPAVRLVEVSRTYGHGDGAVHAVDSVTLDFPERTFTAVMGPSGSGKSTLLQCAAGLDRPTSGSVRVAGTDLADLDEDGLTRMRRGRIGFVFQSFNLLPTLTVRENVTLPAELAGRRPPDAAVTETMELLGLTGRLDHLPGQLSGGQQQRTAIARALLSNPAVVFADEPTGALDSTSARDVLCLLRMTVSRMGRAIIMVTHDPIAAAYADAVVFLANGRVVDTMSAPRAEDVAARMARLGQEALR